MNNGNCDASEKPERDETLFAVVEAVVLVRERGPFEDPWGVDEI
jgi:hypothetical protein